MGRRQEVNRRGKKWVEGEKAGPKRKKRGTKVQ
jgi:hypothetical protein